MERAHTERLQHSTCLTRMTSVTPKRPGPGARGDTIFVCHIRAIFGNITQDSVDITEAATPGVRLLQMNG